MTHLQGYMDWSIGPSQTLTMNNLMGHSVLTLAFSEEHPSFLTPLSAASPLQSEVRLLLLGDGGAKRDSGGAAPRGAPAAVRLHGLQQRAAVDRHRRRLRRLLHGRRGRHPHERLGVRRGRDQVGGDGDLLDVVAVRFQVVSDQGAL